MLLVATVIFLWRDAHMFPPETSSGEAATDAVARRPAGEERFLQEAARTLLQVNKLQDLLTDSIR